MELNDFIGLPIVGTALSLAIQWAKTRWGAESYQTKLAVIAFSLLCGMVYYFLAGTPYWAAVAGILLTSQTFYALFLK